MRGTLPNGSPLVVLGLSVLRSFEINLDAPFLAHSKWEVEQNHYPQGPQGRAGISSCRN